MIEQKNTSVGSKAPCSGHSCEGQEILLVGIFFWALLAAVPALSVFGASAGLSASGAVLVPPMGGYCDGGVGLLTVEL